MKTKMLLALACAVGMAAAATNASAETAGDRVQKAPTKTMGDEGKLPSTEHMSNRVPDMGTAEPAPDDGVPAGRKGPTMRMGNDGKLPATNNMSGQLPTR